MRNDIFKISYSYFKNTNETRRKIFDEIVELIPYNADWKRIKHNSCYVVKVRDYVFLKSYNTIVAYYNTFTRGIIIYDYYSPTTCQHISKFMRLIEDSGYDISTVSYLYERTDRIACIDKDFNYITKWYKSLDKK